MTPKTITDLQALVQADPALAEQLRAAATTDDAVQLLVQAARQQGIEVDASAIAEHSESAKGTQMSDTELEAVAGGLAMMKLSELVTVSILSIGVACVFYSEKHPHAKNPTCITKNG